MNKLKKLGVFVGLMLMLGCEGYQKPNSVDTPPLASLSRSEWPEHGLDAVERGVFWGQCRTCGFPVTDEDVQHGYGDSTNHAGKGYKWKSYVCWRHVVAGINH